MRKEEKAQIIDQVAAQLAETPNFYVTDISGLNAENTTALRRACFEKDVKLMVVKNTLFIKALEKMERRGRRGHEACNGRFFRHHVHHYPQHPCQAHQGIW